MSSTLTSPPKPPLSESLELHPILSLQASAELTWADRLSRWLPIFLLGLPAGLTSLIMIAVTPAEMIPQIPGQSQSLVEFSPNRVTAENDAPSQLINDTEK